MKRMKKNGFTLVELMVVAIIVAILAAVAVPMMTGNKKRAMATEAEAGCGAVRSALRTYLAEHGTLPADGAASTLDTISSTDLDGKYFDTNDYSFDTTGSSNYVITATGGTDPDVAPDADEVDGISIALDQDGDWTRSGL